MPYNKEEGRGTQMKRRPMRRRKKVCVYCVDKNAVIDYKDTNKLKRKNPSETYHWQLC